MQTGAGSRTGARQAAGSHLSLRRRETERCLGTQRGCPEEDALSRLELSSRLITLSGARPSFLITAVLYRLAKNTTAG